MMYQSSEREIRMTLLFVCTADDLVEKAMQAAYERKWEVTQVKFDVYISARRRPHMPEALRMGDGCIALIDFEKDPEQAEAAAVYLQQVFNDRIVVVAVSAFLNTAFVLKAMRAGCTEHLSATDDAKVMNSAFVRAEGHFVSRASVAQVAGSVLALLGAKGGVGTTTLGVHLATYLVQHSRKKVLLIDSKAQFGHVCIYLGMDGSGCHFQEVVSDVHRLDSELLQALVSHHISGLDLLSSPDIGQTARPMHPEDVTATLDFLRGEYDFVVVDCDDSGDEITRAVIAAASQVYLVATPDITAIRDLSRHVDDLSHMETACDVQVVINRYSSQFAVSLEEIEKAIRMPVSFSIPNNYIELVRSANLGEPVSLEGKSGFTLELLKWAQALVGTISPKPSTPHVTFGKKRLWQSMKSFVPSMRSHLPTISATGKGA